MSKYKVGDVAALFSKPKEPTSATGKKLQALFEEFHEKNKSAFQSQEGNSKLKYKSKEENEEQRISKKNKKRKFSSTSDPDLSLSKEQNIKKFKEADSKEFKVKNNKQKNEHFSKDGEFSKKKKKANKLNSFNSENGAESIGISKLNTSPKAKKVKSGFIKKAKHQIYDVDDSFDGGHSKNSPVKTKTTDNSDDSLKTEIKEFIKNNSKKSKKKNKFFNSQEDSQKKSGEDNSSFAVDSPTKHESEVSSNRTNDKKQISDFIRRPKNRKNNTVSKHFETDDNEESRISNEEAFDGNDTLFNEDDDYVKSDNKRFKKKFTNNNSSVQNSPRKTNSKPGFAKLLDRTPENEEDALKRTLFVGNISVNTRLNELKDLFSPFGEIEYVRFKGIENDKAKIFGEKPYKPLNAKYAADSVPAFVMFKERESAVSALTLSGTVFKNHHITVDFALPAGSKKLYDEKLSIFIGNLPFDVQDESIWDAFSDCGKIEGVRVVRDKETGIGKGFGYVLFSTMESRKKALTLKDLTIEGRSIRIKAVDAGKKTNKESNTTAPKRDTFKSRAIGFKKKHKNANTNSRKSITKLVKKEKSIHKKKKIASLLQKSMKL